jgi:hypothetical protein
MGVEHLINYRQQPDWEAEVLRRTDGEGVDHVVEVVGGNNLSKSTAAVRTGVASTPSVSCRAIFLVWSLQKKLRNCLFGSSRTSAVWVQV